MMSGVMKASSLDDGDGRPTSFYCYRPIRLTEKEDGRQAAPQVHIVNKLYRNIAKKKTIKFKTEQYISAS